MKHHLAFPLLGDYIEKGCFIREQESVLYKNGCPGDFGPTGTLNELEADGFVCLCEGDLCNVDKDVTDGEEVEVKYY